MILRKLFPSRARRRPCTPADLQAGTPAVHLEGGAKAAIETGRNRLVVAGMLFALVFTVLGGRLVELMVLKNNGEPPVDRTTELINALQQLPVPDRAPIIDRNGVLMATSLQTAALFADPRKVLDARVAAAELVKVLPDLNQLDLQQKLGSEHSFVWVKRNLSPRQQYAVNALGLPGLYFRDEERRVYPQGPLAAHVLGFTDIDGRGIAGVEQYFDDRLRDPARRGEPLQLSIDVRVQHAVRDELAKAVSEFSALGAAGIVMDVHTGEVLSMVSLPDFDPTQAGDASADARFNRATLGVYELGSVFKTFTMAMALDSGKTSMTGGYDATSPIHIAHFTITDDHPKRRWLSIPEIYMYSSNIGAAKAGLDVGPAGQRAFLDKIGMLRKASIELPEVGAPLLPRRWSTIETMTIAFGHGLSVSPLQLASGVAAMVNGGEMVPATLIKRPPNQPVPRQRVISAHTSEEMRRLMRLVVEEGTGKFAAAPGYLVGGKTGTAEKVGAHGYRQHANLASFVSAFPMNAPRYVVLVVMDEPQGTKATHGFQTAGWNAAPVTGRVINRIAPVLGVAPVNENAPEIRQALDIAIPDRDRQEKRVASN